MSVAVGSRLGPYLVGERVLAAGSGEWFVASEAGLERPVSLVVTVLPGDEAALVALRERARRLVAVTDARLLPVYGQGEDEHVLWLATRQIAGRPLPQLGRLDERRAARLGVQLAGQLAALQDLGIVPTVLAGDDLVVEGEGERERVWLLPDPLRPVAADASGATRSLAGLLETQVGRPLFSETPSDPQTLAELLTHEAGRPHQRRKLIVAAVATAAVVAVAIGVTLALTHTNTGKETAANTPIARVTAHIPLNATAGKLAVGPGNAWAAASDGRLIHIDPRTNAVIGAPLTAFPKQQYVDVALRGDVLWAGGPELLLRLDASTGRVLSRTRIPNRYVSGILVRNGSVWTTLTGEKSPIGRIVKFDPETGSELSSSSPSFGVYPIPVKAIDDTVWALGVDGAFSRIARGRAPTTIALGAQAGFPVESGGRIWVPTRIERTIVAVDPIRMTPTGALRFDEETLDMAAGAGSVWVLTSNPSRIYRIDPTTSRLLGRPLAVPAGASLLEFGDGSLWVDDPGTKALVRLAPTLPAPAAQPSEQPGTVLQNGPIRPNVRLRVDTTKPPFSIVAPDGDWVAEGIAEGSFQIEALRFDMTGVSVNTPTQVFGASERLVPVRAAADFLDVLRHKTGLRVSRVTPITLGGLEGFRVRVRIEPKPPFPDLCQGSPCVLLFPVHRGTFILTKGNDELTFVKRGKTLFFVDASFGERVDPVLARRVRAVVASIRFEK